MDKIDKIYIDLVEYFKEIVITDISETPEDEDGSLSLEYDILYNGKNASGFLQDLDRIIFEIKKELHDSIELENPSIEQKSKIDNIINHLSTDLIAHVPFRNIEQIADGFESMINYFVSNVVEKLHRHKNTWCLRSETLLPGNKSLQWNESINKLVDVFYQFSFELKNANKDNLIKSSRTNLAHFIVNNFVDESGHNLSFHTVYSYLKESKTEDRPTRDKRIEIKYFPL